MKTPQQRYERLEYYRPIFTKIARKYYTSNDTRSTFNTNIIYLKSPITMLFGFSEIENIEFEIDHIRVSFFENKMNNPDIYADYSNEIVKCPKLSDNETFVLFYTEYEKAGKQSVIRYNTKIHNLDEFVEKLIEQFPL